jgi:FMN-dependent NADH-azoreductase
MNVLQINTSARQTASHSSRLATEVVDALRAAHADLRLTVRDLGQNPHAALDEAGLAALFTAAEQRSPEQAARVAENDALIAELQAQDVIVIAAPMINFGVPSQLKNWIDAIARAGVTFKYTASGPVGLVTGKKVHVVSTRGGIHRDQPTDGITPYLRTVLGFLGIGDIEFIYAEGLGMGPEAEAAGLAGARSQIAELNGAVTA